MNAKRVIRVATKAAFTLADPFFGRYRGPRILIYHQIGTNLGREMELSTEMFHRQLDWMHTHGEIIGLEEAIARRGGRDADKLFVLTFDDGFHDVYDSAFPLLKERRLPFTLYLTTGPIESGEPLDPRNPDARPLTWEQITEMVGSGLVTLGAHTHRHADLRHLSSEAITDELDTSNRLIERRTGERPRHFTYPWGWWSAIADPLVRERYESATLGGGGPFMESSDLHRIPRLPIQKSDGIVFFKRKLQTGLRMEDVIRSRLHQSELPAQSSTLGSLLLFLINSLDPGGAERSLVELIPALRNAGFKVLIACLKTAEGTLAEEARTGGAEVLALRSDGWLGWLAEVRRLIRNRRPRLVHTTLFEANMTGRIAAMGTGVPVVMSLVNTSYDPVRLADQNIRPWKLRLVQMVDGWTARHLVDRFHAISEAVKDAAVRDLGLDPAWITVIPRSRSKERLGSPSRDRRHEVRTRLGLPDDAFVLLNVGRQEYQKGQRYLLEAVAELRSERPEVVTLIAGKEGNATEELRALRRDLDLGQAVRFLGHRDDIGDLLAAADVFVFPSLYEGLGGAILEAMAMGLPIVASDLPAIREVVGERETRFLATPGDASGLGAGLEGLIREVSIRQTLSLQNLETFERLFTSEQVSFRMMAWFHQVLESTRTASARSLAGAAEPTDSLDGQ